MYVCIYDPPPPPPTPHPLSEGLNPLLHLHYQVGRCLVWVNGTQNSGLGSFARGSRLPFVQISSIYRKTTAKAWNCYQRWLWRNGTRISVWNIPSGINRTTFSDVPLLPDIFRWNDPKSPVSFTFQPGFPETFLWMVNQPLILVTGRSRSLEGLRRNSVASTNLVKILPTAKMAGELGIVVAFYYY